MIGVKKKTSKRIIGGLAFLNSVINTVAHPIDVQDVTQVVRAGLIGAIIRFSLKFILGNGTILLILLKQ